MSFSASSIESWAVHLKIFDDIQCYLLVILYTTRGSPNECLNYYRDKLWNTAAIIDHPLAFLWRSNIFTYGFVRCSSDALYHLSPSSRFGNPARHFSAKRTWAIASNGRLIGSLSLLWRSYYYSAARLQKLCSSIGLNVRSRRQLPQRLGIELLGGLARPDSESPYFKIET
jgi:hypothetical protein